MRKNETARKRAAQASASTTTRGDMQYRSATTRPVRVTALRPARSTSMSRNSRNTRVERIDRLVDRLLGGEEKFSAQRVVGNLVQFLRRRDQLEHVRRQQHGGFDVDTDAADVALRSNRRYRNLVVVRQ